MKMDSYKKSQTSYLHGGLFFGWYMYNYFKINCFQVIFISSHQDYNNQNSHRLILVSKAMKADKLNGTRAT